ncbi:hypothetical protein [Streptomyces sp. bgisy153]|uniref:hypothetical protein n=1 Tax=Streptomyces sp. bgisy153 TaxID=3413793 RepID=UPI003D71692B
MAETVPPRAAAAHGSPPVTAVAPGTALIRVRDVAGRPRGTGFLADHRGTVVTSHEAVDGLPRLVLHGPGDRACVVTADEVTPLPDRDLALIRTDGLGATPLPITARDRVDTGTYVRIAAGRWREARVLTAGPVTYPATDRHHLIDDALELAIGTDGRDALRLGGPACGGPVLDGATGAVLAVLGTALRSAHNDTGFAVPLRTPNPPDGPLADLLARNAVTVPAYGADLNLAGVLELTAISVGSDGPTGPLSGRDGTAVEPVERTWVTRETAAFAWGSGGGSEGCCGGGSESRCGGRLAGASGGELAGACGGASGGACGGRGTRVAGEGPGGACGEGPTGHSAGEASRAWGGGSAEVCGGSSGGAFGGRSARGAVGHDVAACGDGPAVAAGRSGGVLAGGPTTHAFGGSPAGSFGRSPAADGTGRPNADGTGRPTGASGGNAAGGAARAGAGDGVAASGGSAAGAAPAGAPAACGGSPAGTVAGAAPGVPCGERAVEVRGERCDGAFAPGDGLGAPCGERPDGAHGGRPTAVLALVGAPGSGRTTELAALAARRARGRRPAPTLWLRGADLGEDDTSIADAAHRALVRAARIVAASRPDAAADLGDITPDRLAHLASAAGRPLMLLLDGPEEMPPVLAHRLPAWTRGTAAWLRDTGARLVVSCRPEYWEGAGAEFPQEMLYRPSSASPDDEHPAAGDGRDGKGGPGADETLPPCLRLTDLTPVEAAEARRRYAIPAGALTEPAARHPLTLRLLSEVRAACPALDDRPDIDRDAVFTAHLDLMCLRVAVRLAAENGLRGTAVRRLAAKVSGQVHAAARRSLGPGQGELDRESFEAVFPWGPAPARLGGGTGWASAVLTEGLLVPAGGGYRFAHEELADWIQGMHLDLDEALRTLVHRPRTPADRHPLPVPHHRIGPVVESLLHLARQQGPDELAARLRDLVAAWEAAPDSWWAARLLTETARRVPDATPYLPVLRLLADRVVAHRRRPEGTPGTPPAPDGTGPAAPPALPREFAPDFWTSLTLPADIRLDLLRRLVLADPAPQDTGTPRYLDAVARLLAADPTAVQPRLTRWFDDERPLPATPHATVATAAQALLHTHRHGALDHLTEVLADCAHRRADQLLAVLAEDEPSALCRAVDRWAHDERPDRRVAAVAYGLRAVPHVHTDADRRLLRHAALALLARPADVTLHSGALALLVRDPETRAAHLPQALERFAAGDPGLEPDSLLAALDTHPEPVLDAFRARLNRPGADTGRTLRALADVTTPALAGRVTVLVGEALAHRPDTAAGVAAYVDRRLDQGPAARAVLVPLVTEVLTGGPERVRAALAAVLAAPGAPASRPLRQELREFQLAHEREPSVLAAVLHAVAPYAVPPYPLQRYEGEESRALVRRVGLLMVRTPEGAALFDRGLVDLGRHVPGFAARVAGWLIEAPGEWAAVVGPSARRMIENQAGVRVPA